MYFYTSELRSKIVAQHKKDYLNLFYLFNLPRY